MKRRGFWIFFVTLSLASYPFVPIPVSAQIGPIKPPSSASSASSASTISAALYCLDAGASDTYTCTVTPAITAYADGLCLEVDPNTANTGASTLNVNSLGAVALVKANSGAITTATVTGDILAGQKFLACHDGTNFQILARLASTAAINIDNAFTVAQTISASNPLSLSSSASTIAFSAPTTTGMYLGGRTEPTPDGPIMALGSTSRSFRIQTAALLGTDLGNGICGTAQCANPTLTLFSVNSDAQEYVSLWTDGNGASLAGANSTAKSGQITFGRTVALTEAGGAETVLTITTATTESFGLTLEYTVRAVDATPDYAIRRGSLKYVCVNNATVVTCTKDATNETDDESVLINTNSKTLTYAIASDVATANVAKITFNIDSDMTVTAASITMTVKLDGSGTIS